jgi:hypothetical protein
MMAVLSVVGIQAFGSAQHVIAVINKKNHIYIIYLEYYLEY